jgi:hypothetical protein
MWRANDLACGGCEMCWMTMGASRIFLANVLIWEHVVNVTWKSGKLGEEGRGLGEEEMIKIKCIFEN